MKPRAVDTTVWGTAAILVMALAVIAVPFFSLSHEWMNSEPAKQDDRPHLPKQYLLPNPLANIAQVSEDERESLQGNVATSSELSQSLLRLQRTLAAYPTQKPADVLRAANRVSGEGSMSACPFEMVGGEQSLVLGHRKDQAVSLTKVLNHCIEVVEQMKRDEPFVSGRTATY